MFLKVVDTILNLPNVHLHVTSLYGRPDVEFLAKFLCETIWQVSMFLRKMDFSQMSPIIQELLEYTGLSSEIVTLTV